MRTIQALVGFAAILIVAAVAVVALSQDGAGETRARVSARPLSDGRIEFALQLEAGFNNLQEEEQDATSTNWGDRILTRSRNFPAEPDHDRWLSSSPPIRVGEVETRIRARRLDDGRTEFALQQKSDGENWAESILPSGRYLSPEHRTSHIDRWLNSSQVTLATEIVIPEVAVPAGVPIVAEAVLAYADLDGWTYNGNEPSFYYGVRQDPLDDAYDTWVIKAARTDDSLYDTIRLQISCYGGNFEVFFWEDSLPYQSSNSRIRVSYRFDGGDVATERWSHYSSSDDGFYPADQEAFVREMRRSNTLVVRAVFYSRTITATFTGVSDMFRTRVQPNIDYCGHY